MENDFSGVLASLEDNERAYKYFCMRIVSLLTDNPALEDNGMQCVHSVRYRKNHETA